MNQYTLIPHNAVGFGDSAVFTGHFLSPAEFSQLQQLARNHYEMNYL